MHQVLRLRKRARFEAVYEKFGPRAVVAPRGIARSFVVRQISSPTAADAQNS
jgi:hypothetical protein